MTNVDELLSLIHTGCADLIDETGIELLGDEIERLRGLLGEMDKPQ